MAYIVALFFSLGLGWLTEFLWADYLALALGPDLYGQIMGVEALALLAGISPFSFSLLIGALAVAPALAAGDLRGSSLNGAVLGAAMGGVLAAFVFILSPESAHWATALLTIMVAAAFGTAQAAIGHSVGQLLFQRRPDQAAPPKPARAPGDVFILTVDPNTRHRPELASFEIAA